MNDELLVKSRQSESLREALGITENRCKVLCHLIEDIHERHNGELQISDILAEASKECDNANELAFVSFVLGTHAVPTDSIGTLLSAMLVTSSRRRMQPFGEPHMN